VRRRSQRDVKRRGPVGGHHRCSRAAVRRTGIFDLHRGALVLHPTATVVGGVADKIPTAGVRIGLVGLLVAGAAVVVAAAAGVLAAHQVHIIVLLRGSGVVLIGSSMLEEIERGCRQGFYSWRPSIAAAVYLKILLDDLGRRSPERPLVVDQGALHHPIGREKWWGCGRWLVFGSRKLWPHARLRKDQLDPLFRLGLDTAAHRPPHQCLPDRTLESDGEVDPRYVAARTNHLLDVRLEHREHLPDTHNALKRPAGGLLWAAVVALEIRGRHNKRVRELAGRVGHQLPGLNRLALSVRLRVPKQPLQVLACRDHGRPNNNPQLQHQVQEDGRVDCILGCSKQPVARPVLQDVMPIDSWPLADQDLHAPPHGEEKGSVLGRQRVAPRLLENDALSIHMKPGVVPVDVVGRPCRVQNLAVSVAQRHLLRAREHIACKKRSRRWPWHCWSSGGGGRGLGGRQVAYLIHHSTRSRPQRLLSGRRRLRRHRRLDSV